MIPETPKSSAKLQVDLSVVAQNWLVPKQYPPLVSSNFFAFTYRWRRQRSQQKVFVMFDVGWCQWNVWIHVGQWLIVSIRTSTTSSHALPVEHSKCNLLQHHWEADQGFLLNKHRHGFTWQKKYSQPATCLATCLASSCRTCELQLLLLTVQNSCTVPYIVNIP